jgi:hypothetical protein
MILMRCEFTEEAGRGSGNRALARNARDAALRELRLTASGEPEHAERGPSRRTNAQSTTTAISSRKIDRRA